MYAAPRRVPLCVVVARSWSTHTCVARSAIPKRPVFIDADFAAVSAHPSLTNVKRKRPAPLRRARRGRLADEPQFADDYEKVDQRLTLQEILDVLETEEAEDVQVIDALGRFDYCEHIVIGSSSSSSKHVARMAKVLRTKARIRQLNDTFVEGAAKSARAEQEWIVVDTGPIVVHLLTTPRRKEADLETHFLSTIEPPARSQITQLCHEAPPPDIAPSVRALIIQFQKRRRKAASAGRSEPEMPL